MPSLLELEAQGLDAYEFDERFEAEVVIYLCRSARFYGLFGEHFVVELFRSTEAQLAVEYAKKIYAETNRPPGGISVLIQRLAEERRRGKKDSEINALIDYFDRHLDNPRGLSEEEAVAARVTQVLRKDMQRQFAEKVILQLKPNGSDFDQLGEELTKISALGKDERRTTLAFGGSHTGSWSAIETMANTQRLPLGVEALDAYMEGGIDRGGLAVICGEPGFGKSQACCHAGAAAYATGAFVFYITAELPIGEIFARSIANLTGIPTNAIKKSAFDLRSPKAKPEEKKIALAIKNEVELRLREFEKNHGVFAVGEATANVSTIEDCIELVKREEKRYRRKVDYLIIDPADRLAVPKQASGYQAGQIIYDGFRGFLHSENVWGLTACQATRKKTGKDARKYIDLPDMADSIHKARIADIVISINEDPDDGSIFFFVAKHRTGNSRRVIGNYRTDFACARLIKTTSLNDDVLPTEEGY